MTDERTGHDTQMPAPTSSGAQMNTPAPTDPEVVEAVDESGASSGGGALGGTDSHPGLHDVSDEQAATSQPTPVLDADGDGELAARLVDSDGDGTADDAVVNVPDGS